MHGETMKHAVSCYVRAVV